MSDAIHNHLRDLANLLVPLFPTVDAEKAFVADAFGSTPALLNQVEYGAPRVFALNLIVKLLNYGTIDSKPALQMLANYLKQLHLLDTDKTERVFELCQILDTVSRQSIILLGEKPHEQSEVLLTPEALEILARWETEGGAVLPESEMFEPSPTLPTPKPAKPTPPPPANAPAPAPVAQPSRGGKIREVIDDFIDTIRPSRSESAPDGKPDTASSDEFGATKEEKPREDAKSSPPPALRPAPGAALPPAARPPSQREEIPAPPPPMAEDAEKAAPPKETDVVSDEMPDWLMDGMPTPEPAPIEVEEADENVPAAQDTQPAPVMFSAYPPKVAKKDEWQPLLAYVFRETAAQAVIADALKQLGEKQARFSQVTTLGKKVISEGAEIVARPTMAGFQFKPLEVKIGFYDEWQRFNFELRAKDAPLNKFATGNITFTVEGLIVADVPLSVYVGDESAAGEISSTVTRMYQAIFCSYSHDDTKIVERVERAYKALGLDYLRDITTLKSGTEWSEELLKLIDRADIFQLFWSQAAADSPYVKQEWQHALSLDHDSSNFIRPVYWQQPIPHVPDALRHIHFAYQPDLDD